VTRRDVTDREILGVVFDKDGTLLDFHATWDEPYGAMLAHFAEGDEALFTTLCRELGFDREQGTITADSLFVHASNDAFARRLGEVLGRTSAEFDAHAAIEACLDEVTLVVPVAAAGAADLLAELHNRGIPMSVATNDSETRARAQLRALGWERYFDAVLGFDSGFPAKPDQAMVDAAAAAMGLRADQVVMVGDSGADMGAGRSAGSLVALVGPRAELVEQADVVLTDILELLPQIWESGRHMARVFVSYRRADGRMAVDWLAERLQTLDLVTGIQTAFHDGGLKAGENFADALMHELDDCKLVIAVIGPNWEGRSDTGPSRIQDPDDWVVTEIATAMRLKKHIMPVLIGGAELPTTADLHSSIDSLPGRHTLLFERADHLETLVTHIGDFLGEIDRAEATEAGLKDEIVVPELAPRKLLVPLLLAGGVVGALIAWFSAFQSLEVQLLAGELALPDDVDSVQTTAGYDWYQWILLLYAVVGGVAAPMGALISVRIARRSINRWKEMLAAAAMVAAVPILMILSTGGSHLILNEESSRISHGELRAFGNLLAISIALGTWAYAIGAPIFSEAKAPAHQLGDRVMHLALMRDGERWAIIIASTVLSIGTAVGVALAAAAVQSGAVVDGAAADFDELQLIALPVVLSALIVVGHRWAVASMAEVHVNIDTALQKLADPYRSHGVGKMAAAPFADGGWAFRFVLMMPVIVALAGIGLYHLL